MLKLELFARRNFAIGNLETLTMYAGLSILFFFLVIYLQQVAGYTRAAERADDAAGDDRRCSCSPAASARSPTATARGCSWARARWSPRRASCCSSEPGMHDSYLADLLPGAARLLARAVDDGRAADRDRARRRGRERRRDRLGDQQRGRPRRRARRRLRDRRRRREQARPATRSPPNDAVGARVPRGDVICAALVAAAASRARSGSPIRGGRLRRRAAAGGQLAGAPEAVA